MSFAALATISKMRLGSAAEKLVALAYADRHNEETGCAYPSIAWLCEFSSLNRKTVVAAVARLEAAGLLSDSGERRGDTKQIKVYRLHFNNTENGTVPKPVQSQKRNSSEKVVKQSQKRDTEPVRTSLPLPIATQSSEEGTPAELTLLPDHVLEAWNEMAGRLRLSRAKMNDKRRARLRVLIRHHPIVDFTEAIGCIERNRWMHGENERGWRADFDFLLQDKSFVKLIEGSYDRAQ